MFFVGRNFVIDTDGERTLVICKTTNNSLSFDNLEDDLVHFSDILGFIDMETAKIKSKGYFEGFSQGKMSTNELIKKKVGGKYE